MLSSAQFLISLQRLKASTSQGQTITDIEQDLPNLDTATTVSELDDMYKHYSRVKDQLRSFYYSNTFSRKRKQLEYIYKKKYIDNLCAFERRIMSNGHTTPMIFVGDRGICVGSRIKGHLKMGDHRKPIIHGRYTPVFITNERNTSQTCVYCFQKLSHPATVTNGKVKSIRGAFLCQDPKCPSTLAIGLSGLAWLLFGRTFP
jgi:hypothetical protein